MTKLEKSLLIALVIGGFIIGFLSHEAGNRVVGSVEQGSEYQATTTVGMAVGLRSLACTQTLGSVIVASSSAGTLKIWNATSTTDTASSTIATFIASPVQGTYTFDAILTRGGIGIELGSGFNGSYTITCR